MTAQHTPEPWRTIKDHNGNDYGVQMGSAGGFALYRDANAEANSRRIVACVNACAGLTTEFLESVPNACFVANTTESVSVQLQRDELAEQVAELEKATELWSAVYWELAEELHRYGRHLPNCPAGIADSHHACNCGLSAARVDARPVWGASKPATNTIPENVIKASGRCKRCDGVGDVYGFDGEWRGECTECEAAKARGGK